MEFLRLNFFLISIIASIILYMIISIFRFYSRVKHYPRGPTPLPFVGNLLMYVTKIRNPFALFDDLAQRYGELYTFWFGSKPIVVISDADIARQAFSRSEISDRVEPFIHSKISETIGDNFKSFVLMNHNTEFKVLRKLSAEALRKFISSNRMSEITQKIVDETVDIMKTNESGKPFMPFKYIESILVRSLFEITYNEKVAFEDEKVNGVWEFFHTIEKSILLAIIAGYIPLLNLFIDTSKQKSMGERFMGLISKRFYELKKTYNGSDLSHSLSETHILAANNLQSDDEDKAKYLSDTNIIGNIATLFTAGGDTIHFTLQWMPLLMAYYPEIQQRMRDEINTNIGKRVPLKADKDNCHFVNAFICETLRFRNFIPLSLFHLTSSDTKIGNTTIPKGTLITTNLLTILHDKRHWNKPESFEPQRFLDSEQHFINSIPAFIPFGAGKRMCVGDKFSIDMLFLVLTRLLQATDGLTFELDRTDEKNSSILEPKRFAYFVEPKPYKLCLVPNKA